MLVILAASAAWAAEAPLNERVLVVYNGFSKESKGVAAHYMRARGIPAANKCELKPVEFKAGASYPIVYVALADYPAMIAQPIQKCLEKVGKEKILYIVLTYDTPYRLSGTSPNAGVAIDSYIADVWNSVGGRSMASNPYYAASSNAAARYPKFKSLADYRSEPAAKLIYSVWRLDASSPELAKGLVDKALEAEKAGLTGVGCFDRRRGSEKDMGDLPDYGYAGGDWDIFRAAEFAREAGFKVIEDYNDAEFGTPPAPLRCDDAALYAGWYSINHYNDVFSWRTGAIGFHLDSASAANPRAGTNWSAHAITRGITVTSGAVGEPYLTGLPHPAGVFRNLFEGANVGDAFLRNTAQLRWQIMNIGDPLYTPFPGGRGPFRKNSSADAPAPR